MADDPARPPLLIGLDLEQAQQRAQDAGWEVAGIIRTAPPNRPISGPLRVVRQRASASRSVTLTAAASVTLACPHATDALE